MAFTAKDVQILRERTGCGMMECKKALTETDGDMDKAIEVLRERGLAAATKKAGRIAAEGLIYVHTDGDRTVMIEVNAETDFVTKNEEFKSFVIGCAKSVLKNNTADVNALLESNFDGSNLTVSEMIREKILVIGENMTVRRFIVLTGNVVSYVHDGKIGVLAFFDTDVAAKDGFSEMGKNVCMQVTAMNPEFLKRDDVPVDSVNKEKEILLAQIENDEKNKSKPANVIEKMITGRINKFFEQNCLLEQVYVKDDSFKVGAYIESVAKDLGGSIVLKQFIRYEKGEGIQKREDNFADEVASMMK